MNVQIPFETDRADQSALSWEGLLMARDDDLGALWKNIRAAEALATQALRELAVHQAECRGAQALIANKLNLLIWLLGSLAGVVSAGLGAFCGWAAPRLFGG